jgi:hypothetical protein
MAGHLNSTVATILNSSSIVANIVLSITFVSRLGSSHHCQQPAPLDVDRATVPTNSPGLRVVLPATASGRRVTLTGMSVQKIPTQRASLFTEAASFQSNLHTLGTTASTSIRKLLSRRVHRVTTGFAIVCQRPRVANINKVNFRWYYNINIVI